MENKFNHKIEKIAVSSIRQFDAEASAIPGIIKLTLGNPTSIRRSISKKLLKRRLMPIFRIIRQMRGFPNCAKQRQHILMKNTIFTTSQVK